MTPAERRKLEKIASLLASPNAGERASAALHATEILTTNEMTWADVIAYLPKKEPVEVTFGMIFDAEDMEDIESVLEGKSPLENDLIFKNNDAT